MTNLKLIVGLAVILGLLAVSWKNGRDLAEMTARAEKAETRADDLAAANVSLEDAVRSCNQAATAQVGAAQAALARREALDEIMTCPAAPAAGAPTKGEALNENQDSQMVAYWNSLYSGLGLRGQ